MNKCMKSDTENTNHLKNKTVLIVDDYDINVELMKIFVQETGALALSASNGTECLELIQNHDVDMVLMDLNMPEMNGIDATKAIRAMPQHKDVVIIGVIGYEDKEEIDTCRQAGMNDAVPKFTFNPDKLIEFGNIYFGGNSQPPQETFTDLQAVSINRSDISGDSPVMDFDRALKEFDNDTELLLSLLQKFSVIVCNQLDIMNKAFENNDYKKIEIEAHSIKGGAANICAVQLSDAAGELENSCKTDQPGEVIFLNLSTLKMEINDLCTFINHKCR